jgi:putative acyl-CoA dehydrogenase
VVEKMGIALEASLLLRHSPAAVADAYCGSRLTGHGGRAYGTLAPGTDFPAIIERHRPKL